MKTNSKLTLTPGSQTPPMQTCSAPIGTFSKGSGACVVIISWRRVRTNHIKEASPACVASR